MSRYKKHWGFRAAWNSHQIPKLHQSWWQSLSEPLVPLPSLCHFRSQWPQGDKQGGVMLLFLPQTLSPHSHGSPEHIHDLAPASAAFKNNNRTWFPTQQSFQPCLTPRCPHSQHTTTWVLCKHGAGAHILICTSSGVHEHFLQCREQSQSTQGFILIYFFSFHFFFPPPTPVVAVTENNGFVGGFKTSERENKHCCSLCSKAGNSIKEVEIKEWGCSSSSGSSKAITTCKGKPWQLREGWNLACPWSCSYYYNTAWLKISNQTKEIPAGKG